MIGIIISVFVCLLCLSKMRHFCTSMLSFRGLALILTLKLIAGSVQSFIYTYYYPNREEADMYKYLHDAGIIFRLLPTNPSLFLQVITGIYIDKAEIEGFLKILPHWTIPIYPGKYNDARLIIRFNAILQLINGGKIFVNLLFYNLLALAGNVYLEKWLIKHMKSGPGQTFFLAYLIPGILFWTSGLIRESLISLFFFGFIYHLFELENGFKKRNIFGSALMFMLLIYSRSYLLYCLIPGFSAYILYKFLKKKPLLIFISVNLILIGLAFSLKYFNSSWDIVHDICFKRGEYIYLAERIHTGSLITNTYLDFTPLSLLKAVPESLVNSIFRPFPWEIKSIMYIFPLIENLLFTWILLRFFRFRRLHWNVSRYFMLNIALCILILVGLTIPVLGSIVRYRIFALPFLFATFLEAKEIDIPESLKLFLLRGSPNKE